MKWTSVIIIVLTILLTTFATLYLFFPKQETVVIEKAILDKVPGAIEVKFKPVPPDTIRKMSMQELTDYLQEMHIEVSDLKKHLVDQSGAPLEVTTVAEKSFRQALLGEREDSLAYIISNVTTFGMCSPALISNDINIKLYKENLLREYISNIPQQPNKLGTGILIGACSVSVLAAAGFLIVGAF